MGLSGRPRMSLPRFSTRTTQAASWNSTTRRWRQIRVWVPPALLINRGITETVLLGWVELRCRRALGATFPLKSAHHSARARKVSLQQRVFLEHSREGHALVAASVQMNVRRTFGSRLAW